MFELGDAAEDFDFLCSKCDYKELRSEQTDHQNPPVKYFPQCKAVMNYNPQRPIKHDLPFSEELKPRY